MVPNLARVYHPKVLALCFCTLLVVVGQSSGQSSSQDPILEEALSDWGMNSLYHMDRGVRGAASCAASSCHGGPKAAVASSVAARGSEYPIWYERDPHAQSWKTISSEISTKILSRLGILRDGKIEDIAGYQNCLACHNTDRNLGADSLAPRIAEGVGCESCHGPSQAWYSQHYQGPSSTQTARQNLGMTETGPLLQRARICATCHVGGKDRDMNHDIIAAGHPALYFDMAVYHERYPKHWRDPEQKSNDFRSRLWLAGQIAAADAELELMETRACKSLSVSTWPELSSYQCNSCHVSLSGRPKTSKPSNRELVATGRAPVRSWNLGGLALLSDFSSHPESGPSVSAEKLRELLQAPNPDPKIVAMEAKKLRVAVYESLRENGILLLPAWSRQNQIQLTFQKLEATMRSNSWETAAWVYTAAWATNPRLANGELELAMKTMRNGLLFPRDLMVPDYPRSESGTSPTIQEWKDSLHKAGSALRGNASR